MFCATNFWKTSTHSPSSVVRSTITLSQTLVCCPIALRSPRRKTHCAVSSNSFIHLRPFSTSRGRVPAAVEESHDGNRRPRSRTESYNGQALGSWTGIASRKLGALEVYCSGPAHESPQTDFEPGQRRWDWCALRGNLCLNFAVTCTGVQVLVLPRTLGFVLSKNVPPAQ
jgi:hypothetical protein